MKQHSLQACAGMSSPRLAKMAVQILASVLMLLIVMPANVSARDVLPVISLESDHSYNRALSIARLPESQSEARFRVKLSSPSTNTVRVMFFTRDGFFFFNSDERNELGICDKYYSHWNSEERCWATPGRDFYGVSRQITFTPGQTEKSVSVQILNNPFAELNQIFEARLARPENGVLADEDSAQTPRWWVVIDDDDVSPTGSALQLQIPGDPRNSGPALVDEGIGTLTSTLRLNPPSPNPVEVIVYTTSRSATEGQDYKGIRERIVFQPGETSKPVPLEIYDDLVEEPLEYIQMVLAQPIGATIVPPHPEYGDPYIAIVDNEALPKITFDLDQISSTVNENETQVRVVVRAERQVVSFIKALIYTSNTGSAQPGRDYWGTAQEIKILPGDVRSNAVYITLINDAIAEADENFQLRLVNASNATISESALTITVTDDDI